MLATPRAARSSWPGRPPDGRHRHRRERGSSCRASPAARARSTRSATATTARRSSPASRPARAARTSRHPGLRHRRRRRRARGREHRDGVRAAALRRRRDLRGRRRRRRDGRSASPRASPRTTCSASTRTCSAHGVTLLGPNCPGVLIAGQRERRHHPGAHLQAGQRRPGLRSGTLTYQIGNELAHVGIGRSTIVGIGGDPIVGSLVHRHPRRCSRPTPQTDMVVMVGEIGGNEEEQAAEFIAEHMTKPVVGLHRGLHGAAGQDDGSRRRDHLRLVRHRRGQEGSARGARRARRHEPDRGRAAGGRALCGPDRPGPRPEGLTSGPASTTVR